MQTTTSNHITETMVTDLLRKVLDPELGIDIVSLGLIYKVSVAISTLEKTTVTILMTLTTPGCPLADSFDSLVRQALLPLPGIDPEEDVIIQLTFDPPWVRDMMSEEAKAELGFF